MGIEETFFWFNTDLFMPSSTRDMTPSTIIVIKYAFSDLSKRSFFWMKWLCTQQTFSCHIIGSQTKITKPLYLTKRLQLQSSLLCICWWTRNWHMCKLIWFCLYWLITIINFFARSEVKPRISIFRSNALKQF